MQVRVKLPDVVRETEGHFFWIAKSSPETYIEAMFIIQDILLLISIPCTLHHLSWMALNFSKLNKHQNRDLSEKGRKREENKRGWRKTGSSLHHKSEKYKITVYQPHLKFKSCYLFSKAKNAMQSYDCIQNQFTTNFFFIYLTIPVGIMGIRLLFGIQWGQNCYLRC